jgi:hypothetical protein
MKAAFFTFVIAAAVPAFAQQHLSDRWKEVQRLDLKNKPVAYSDTMRLLGVTKDGMGIRKGSFVYKGQINNDVLDVSGVIYGILKNDENEIRLRDEEFIYVFAREAKDMSAADAVESKTRLDLPASPVAAVDKNILKGDWEAYKRTSRKGPMDKVNYKTLIKTLSFRNEKTGNYYGSVTTDFVGGASLYFIKDTGGSDIITEDKDQKQHLLKVWRLTADELVVEDETGIIYFMKHFR